MARCSVLGRHEIWQDGCADAIEVTVPWEALTAINASDPRHLEAPPRRAGHRDTSSAISACHECCDPHIPELHHGGPFRFGNEGSSRQPLRPLCPHESATSHHHLEQLLSYLAMPSTRRGEAVPAPPVRGRSDREGVGKEEQQWDFKFIFFRCIL